MSSLQGRLLIAAPSLTDPNFARTIVLIAAHSDTGALGLILNRELESGVADVWREISSEPCTRTERLHHGGPVAGTLMAVHDRRPYANIMVADDLYVATELNAMEALAASTDGRVLFYLGHSGWGPGQLEDELEVGSWMLIPATDDHVFNSHSHDADSLWRAAATDAGRREIHAIIDPRHVPEDPRSN